MSLLRKASWVVSVAVLLAGCSRSLPEAYGIYADTDGGQVTLRSQGTRVAGNLLQPIYGLQGPSGSECRVLRDIIVYKKDVQPDSVGLVRLAFEGEVTISGFLGANRTNANLWLPKERIDLAVKPAEQHRDMYIMTPRKALGKGFYAVYVDSLGEMGMPGAAYDFVVGAAKDFPSYQVAVAAKEQGFRERAVGLLARMNEMLNARSYDRLQEVYRPGGNVLAGKDLDEFVTGSRTWLNSAGKILQSHVTTLATPDGAQAHCSVETTYEKAGMQKEAMTIRKIGDQYYITAIQ
jgi:hypothetical protein